MSEELKKGIPKAIPTGKKIEFSKEEKIRHDKDMERILKEIGVLAKDETIENVKKIKPGRK